MCNPDTYTLISNLIDEHTMVMLHNYDTIQ